MKSHFPPLRERERARKHPAEGVIAMPLPSEPHTQRGRECLRIKWLKASSSLVFFSILSYTALESQVLEDAQDNHMLANGAVQIVTTATQPTMKTHAEEDRRKSPLRGTPGQWQPPGPRSPTALEAPRADEVAPWGKGGTAFLATSAWLIPSD